MVMTGLTSAEPLAPPDADFAIYIGFDRTAPHPERVFRALDGLITALSRLDTALASAISPSIEPVLMLEDIEAGSIKVWLRNALQTTDDQALHKLDWKSAVGKYLVAAKYAFISWVNEAEANPSKTSLVDLRNTFLRLASETDVKRMADYAPPSANDLIESAGRVSQSLALLGPRDTAKLITPSGDLDFHVGLTWGPETIAELAIRETLSMPPAPMILAVKRPDYLSSAQWEFRHGKRTIRARIEDEAWLLRFHSRRVDVRPGDALRCEVAVDLAYGYDNDLISETFIIKRVLEVLEDQIRQADIFDDPSPQ